MLRDWWCEKTFVGFQRHNLWKSRCFLILPQGGALVSQVNVNRVPLPSPLLCLQPFPQWEAWWRVLPVGFIQLGFSPSFFPFIVFSTHFVEEHHKLQWHYLFYCPSSCVCDFSLLQSEASLGKFLIWLCTKSPCSMILFFISSYWCG